MCHIIILWLTAPFLLNAAKKFGGYFAQQPDTQLKQLFHLFPPSPRTTSLYW